MRCTRWIFFLCFMHFHIVDIQVREVKALLSTKSALVANFQTNLADAFSYIIYHAPMMSSSPGWCKRLMTQYLNMVPRHQSGESMQRQIKSKTNGRNRSLCSCFGSTYTNLRCLKLHIWKPRTYILMGCPPLCKCHLWISTTTVNHSDKLINAQDPNITKSQGQHGDIQSWANAERFFFNCLKITASFVCVNCG